MVGDDGRLLAMNEAFVRIWDFPPNLLARQDAVEMHHFSARQLADPQAFLDRLLRRPAATGRARSTSSSTSTAATSDGRPSRCDWHARPAAGRPHMGD